MKDTQVPLQANQRVKPDWVIAVIIHFTQTKLANIDILIRQKLRNIETDWLNTWQVEFIFPPYLFILPVLSSDRWDSQSDSLWNVPRFDLHQIQTKLGEGKSSGV